MDCSVDPRHPSRRADAAHLVSGVRTSRHSHRPGNRARCNGRRRAGGDRHPDQRGHGGLVPDQDERRRNLSISFRPHWQLHRRGRGDGLCALDARRHLAQHPAALCRRLHAEAQQHCRDRHRHERCGRAPDPGGVARRRRPVEGHQRSSLERPQLHVPCPVERRRRAGAAGYARHGGQRQLLRERPEQLRQQLSARRRGQQLQPRRLRQRRGLRVPAVGGRAAGIQGADQQLQRRAWPGERRRAQRQPEIGRRAVPRQPVRVLSKLCDGRDQLLRRVPRPGEGQVQPQPVRRPRSVVRCRSFGAATSGRSFSPTTRAPLPARRSPRYCRRRRRACSRAISPTCRT